jgi:CheY-like chemotaxis protein
MSPSPDQEDTLVQHRRRVLVVDDEPTLRLGFSYALESHATQVDTASSGRQALERMKNAVYDLLILDLRMPDIDGLGVIEALRQTGNTIPIVLCSAALTPLSVIRAFQHRVPDFLLKPVRPADLREVVDYVLSPPDNLLARTLAAIRSGNFPLALQHAESDPHADHGTTAWAKVLHSLLHPSDEENSPAEENLIRSSLSTLAFRASPNPT